MKRLSTTFSFHSVTLLFRDGSLFSGRMLRLLILPFLLLTPSCKGPVRPSWTEEESMLVWSAEETMHVLTVEDSLELKVLRAESSPLNAADLQSPTYQRLAAMMLATVTSPEQDGVGIAAPQVGISRRVVAVQRFDKEGEPFEVYPNIIIAAVRGEKVPGPEGCLSVPGLRGMVPRWRDIDISYSVLRNGALRDTLERVQGFTAVIFQHETDHLEGILYTDCADSVGPR